MLSSLKDIARRLKTQVVTLYFVGRDHRTPLFTKLVVAGVVAYALSPIDLVPDFIPVLGILDDLILLPLGITLALRLTPEIILRDCTQRAQDTMLNKMPRSRKAALFIVACWLLAALLGCKLLFDRL